jgi:hypothetical protein
MTCRLGGHADSSTRGSPVWRGLLPLGDSWLPAATARSSHSRIPSGQAPPENFEGSAKSSSRRSILNMPSSKTDPMNCPMNCPMLSNSRVAVNFGKLWEIHSITKIEVQQGGVWKGLDQP